MSQNVTPLAGLKVLDATSNIAGPYGGAILADLGAEVLKLETPDGDPSRFMAPLDGDRSAYFHIVNRNKKVVTVNLKSEDGKKAFDEHLAESDVFLTNFLPDRLKSLGISSEELMLKHPRLIIGNLTSYGSSGDDAKSPGYDATVQARTGIMYITGEPDGQPVRTGVSVLDIGSGMWLAMGILAAIIERDKTGKGSIVETSLYETGIAWVSYHLSANQISGNPSVRSGAGHPTFSPYGIFQTYDGMVCIGVGNNEIFAKLCRLIHREALITDVRFVENVTRVENHKVLRDEIESALASDTAANWAKKLGQNGVPADIVVAPEALFNDPQQLAVNMLLKNPDESSPVKLIPGLPLKFNGKRPEIYRTAPKRN